MSVAERRACLPRPRALAARSANPGNAMTAVRSSCGTPCGCSDVRFARGFASPGGEAAVAAVCGRRPRGPSRRGRPGRAGRPRSAPASPARDCAALLSPKGFGREVAGMTPRALPGGRTAPARRTSSPLRVETLGACAARRGPTARAGSAPPARVGGGWLGSEIQSAPAEAGGNVIRGAPVWAGGRGGACLGAGRPLSLRC